ncbi:SGNH/GDSL hydrolase family protein [Modestobacter muralis]|uniref:SGNH/GDSL hydrolase family protein n=1 Tax=Modestobacter muralis TaxID=1608614 RepID=A0A6P0EZ57_9ACTN|nr:SGNH/GDSL hydrolase family protein [Modestobacter muralis]NEN53357.1 SGNH/GDSL hydrolase family protein [Modestobacter muralis]
MAEPTPTGPAVVRPAQIARTLLLGDGLSLGQGATDPAAGFAALAEAAVPLPFAWDVQASAGGTLDGVLDQADLPDRTDAVVVELGTNDWEAVPAARFATSYRDRLAGLRDRYPEALVLCLGVWQPPSRPETVAYDDAVRAGCESVGGRFVQLSDVYADPANHRSGQADANPGDAGYRIIADRVIAVLRSP